MGLLSNIMIWLSYKKEITKKLNEQSTKIDKKILNKCVDLALLMHKIYNTATKTREIKADENSMLYGNQFININLKELNDKLNNSAKNDDSYIG